jgi:hypothetical protein
MPRTKPTNPDPHYGPDIHGAHAIRKLADMTADTFSIKYGELRGWRKQALPVLMGPDGKKALHRLMMGYNIGPEGFLVLNSVPREGGGLDLEINAMPRDALRMAFKEAYAAGKAGKPFPAAMS